LPTKPPDHLSGHCLIADAIRREALAQGVTVEQLADAAGSESKHIGLFLANRQATNTRKASRLLRLLGLRIVPAKSGKGEGQ